MTNDDIREMFIVLDKLREQVTQLRVAVSSVSAAEVVLREKLTAMGTPSGFWPEEGKIATTILIGPEGTVPRKVLTYRYPLVECASWPRRDER